MARLAVVINTCAAYEEVAVPPLLDSLRKAGVPMDLVHVVVGECDVEGDEGEAPSRHRRATVNIDNNALLWLTQEPRACEDADVVMILHDTSLVDVDFWTKITKAADALWAMDNMHCMRLYNPSMGMGLYKVPWLKSPGVVAYMASLRNTDPTKKHDIKHNLAILEDTLFKATWLGNAADMQGMDKVVIDEHVHMYGTDVPRILEYYPAAGVYKVKANWGQSWTLLTRL